MATVTEAIDLAKEYLCSNQTNRAEQVFRQILVVHPEQPDALCGLGIITQQQGLTQTAEQYFLNALKVKPGSVEAWFNLGNLHQTLNQPAEAEACYRQVLALKPDLVVAYNNLAYSLQQQGQSKEAIDLYRKALAINREFREAAAGLGSVLHHEGMLSAAERNDYARLNLDLGIKHLELKAIGAAEEYFRQAISLDKENWEGYYRLGYVLQHEGELGEAIDCYQTALAHFPNCAEVYFQLGKLYQNQRDFQSAVEAFRQGLCLINSLYADALESEQAADNTLIIPVAPNQSRQTVEVGGQLFPGLAPISNQDEGRPFWSVIITVYDRVDYLLECLASVLAQWTGQADMEILVIDDASSSSAQIFELVEAIGKGIVQYYRNSQNQGLPGNWNVGIGLSRGQWVHLLHDDDYILPGFYERLQHSLTTCPETVGAAFTGYENVNDLGEVVFSQHLYGKYQGIAQDFLMKIGIANPLNMPAVVVRRQTHEKLGTYHPELTYTSDWELYKRIEAFYDWWYEPITGAHYRQHHQSKTSEMMFSGTQVTSIRRAIEMSENYLPVSHKTELSKQSRRHYFQLCLKNIVIPLKAHNLSAAWRMLQETLSIDRSPEALAELFKWLTSQEASALRDEMASRFTSLSLNELNPRENCDEIVSSSSH